MNKPITNLNSAVHVKPTRQRIARSILTMLLLLLAAALGACAIPTVKEEGAPNFTMSSHNVVTEAPPDETPTPAPTPEPTPKLKRAKVRAVGDIMVSKKQIASAKQKDGSYDFSGVFDGVAPYIEGAELAIGNFETACAGKENGGFTGYPLFNAPEEFLDALKAAGLNVLTTANNHCLDRYGKGLIKTAQNIRERGFLQTGTFVDEQDAKKLLIAEVNGIKIGIAAYTYGTNGNEKRINKEERAWMVNFVDTEAQNVKEDIRRLRKEGAEVIIAAIHCGTEYMREPNERQLKIYEAIEKTGVDIILGSHSHVLQPLNRKTVVTEYGEEKELFTAYSMGNFISEFRAQYGDTGMVLELDIAVEEGTGKVSIENAAYMPTWVQRIKQDGVYKYIMVPAGAAAEEPGLLAEQNEADIKRVREAWEETVSLIGSEYAQPVRTLEKLNAR